MTLPGDRSALGRKPTAYELMWMRYRQAVGLLELAGDSAQDLLAAVLEERRTKSMEAREKAFRIANDEEQRTSDSDQGR